MKKWLENESWKDLYNENSVDKKAEILQNTLFSKYVEYFPEKTRIISSDDQPFYTQKLFKLKRRKAREFNKRRKSNKWEKMNSEYEAELSNAKTNFYKTKIKDLKKANPAKWYKELKKLTSYDQHKSEEVVVEDIKDLSNQEQAELIANKFAEVSLEYEKLQDDDIEIPEFKTSDVPQFAVIDVKAVLDEMDPRKSTVSGDIPSKILKQFSSLLASPVMNVINSCIVKGKWPGIFKLEVVTPVPKEYPPKNIDQLRNISGLLNLNKIAEKLVSRLMICDMKEKLHPT